MSHGTANQESQFAHGELEASCRDLLRAVPSRVLRAFYTAITSKIDIEQVHAQTAERVAASVFLIVIKGRPNGPSSVKGERACCVLRIRSLQ